jgi:hypothetical protein
VRGSGSSEREIPGSDGAAKSKALNLSTRSMLKRSKTSPPCILGLTPMMIAAKNGGARPAAFAPKLARASDTSLIWQAQGSQPKPYLVEAKVPAAGESARGASGIAGWRVRCSCPSGQDLVRSGGLCKHAAAALMQVVDEEAAKVEAALEELKRAHAAARLVQERAELEALDARFPGERARVMHAISLVGEQRLTAFMVDQSKTPAGLEALMGLFPATDFPVRSEAHCFRCGQDYNPNLVTSCKMPQCVPPIPRASARAA